MKRFPRLSVNRVSRVCLILSGTLQATALASGVAVDLRFEVRAQVCELTTPGLRVCAEESMPVALEPIPLPAAGAAVDFTTAASFRGGRYVVHFGGRVSRPQAVGQEDVCLEFLQASLTEPVPLDLAGMRGQCIPVTGLHLPIFFFGSARLDDLRNEPTISLAVTGDLNVQPIHFPMPQ